MSSADSPWPPGAAAAGVGEGGRLGEGGYEPVPTADPTLLELVRAGGPVGEHAQQCYSDNLSYLDIIGQYVYLYLQETEGCPLPIDNPQYSGLGTRGRRSALSTSATRSTPGGRTANAPPEYDDPMVDLY